MNLAEFTNTGLLSRDSAFSVAAQGVRKGSDNLVDLSETRTKTWPTVSELEMSELSWFHAEEKIQRLMETGIVEWICCFRPPHLRWEGPKDIPLTNAVSYKFVSTAWHF